MISLGLSPNNIIINADPYIKTIPSVCLLYKLQESYTKLLIKMLNPIVVDKIIFGYPKLSYKRNS